MLSSKQKKEFKSRANALKVVVSIGSKGLTENVFTELEQALKSHELLKIKLAGGDKDERQVLIEKILETTKAELIQTIGSVAVIFLRNTEKSKPAVKSKPPEKKRQAKRY